MLFKKIICWLFGHKKYNPKVLKGGDFLWMEDELNQKLISINICKRCGELYTDLCRK
jgi:hypothetical protein